MSSHPAFPFGGLGAASPASPEQVVKRKPGRPPSVVKTDFSMVLTPQKKLKILCDKM
jgi:hypothetical protein